MLIGEKTAGKKNMNKSLYLDDIESTLEKCGSLAPAKQPPSGEKEKKKEGDQSVPFVLRKFRGMYSRFRKKRSRR